MRCLYFSYLLLFVSALTPRTEGRKNVLLILVDDLRPEAASSYGQKYMITPNLDRLGSTGVVFEKAYCQQAICGPTRNSFLSGRRPQRTLSWNFLDSFREVGPDWISFPQYFKQNGYVTLATGKTFHPGLPPNWDEPNSWSQDEPYYYSKHPYPSCEQWPNSLACPTDAPFEEFTDWLDMNRTRAQIRRYSNDTNRPFFLVFGAHRPHLPWNMPKPFWDMYSTEKIDLPVHECAPEGMPPIAFTYECDGKSNMTCLNETFLTPFPDAKTALPHNVTRTFRRAYYASVTWTDFLIGELLDTLDDAGVANNTIVALLGDHGWNLGEQNVWGKHTNFELGTRVPMIIRSPGIEPTTVDALVESVDLYPTIAALAQLDKPQDLDGVNLEPLMTKQVDTLKDAVFSEYPRCPTNLTEPWSDRTSCVRRKISNHKKIRINTHSNTLYIRTQVQTERENFTVMGYSVRTSDWRYTVWLRWDGVRLVGDFNRIVAEELYQHESDDGTNFDRFENVNVVNDEKYGSIRTKLFQRAKKHWSREDDTEILKLKKRRRNVSDDVNPADQFELWDEY